MIGCLCKFLVVLTMHVVPLQYEVYNIHTISGYHNNCMFAQLSNQNSRLVQLMIGCYCYCNYDCVIHHCM